MVLQCEHLQDEISPPAVSERKLEANRRNAQLSTGPRTEPGKKHSRRNALKHGIFASILLIEVEDAPAFKKLLDSLRQNFNPHDEVEEMLVERLAVLLWRQRRGLSWEAELIRNPPLDGRLEEILNSDYRTHTLVLPTGAKLDLLLRYEASIHGQIRFVLRELERRQRRRTARASLNLSDGVAGR